MLSHFNGIRQINMKPPDFSVIHTGKAVIETAADIDADRTGIFPEQLFHRFVKHDRPRDNALMGKEPIQFFRVNIKFPDNCNRLIIVYPCRLPLCLIRPDCKRY